MFQPDCLSVCLSACAQKDHDAAFMWNGVNYILKMPSDLDYLADYLAIKKWMGFTLTRNPFCVPYPLDEGKEVLNSKLLRIRHTHSLSHTYSYR